MKDRPDTAQELAARALRLLARREHARAELARKLAPHAESPQALERLLDTLAAKRQLSDERFAEERVRSLSRKYGTARIEADLRAKGVAGETLERAVRAAGADDLARARAILARKFRGAPADVAERARRARFLQSRGFSYEVIRSLLSSRDAG